MKNRNRSMIRNVMQKKYETYVDYTKTELESVGCTDEFLLKELLPLGFTSKDFK